MADVLKFEETTQKEHEIEMVRISKNLKCDLVIGSGKRGETLHGEFTLATQKLIEDCFGAVSAEIVKKLNPASTITAKQATDEAKAQIEVVPEPEPESEPIEP